jgi:hypothetical protein
MLLETHDARLSACPIPRQLGHVATQARHKCSAVAPSEHRQINDNEYDAESMSSQHLTDGSGALDACTHEYCADADRPVVA